MAGAGTIGPDAARGDDSVAVMADLLMAPMSEGLWQCADGMLDGVVSAIGGRRRCLEVAEARVLAEQVRRRTAASGMAVHAAVNRVGDALALAASLSTDQARARAGFAVGLDGLPDTLDGVADGAVSRGQAGKIIMLVDTVPDAPGRGQTVAVCERALLEAARISEMFTAPGAGRGDYTGALGVGEVRRIACDATVIPVVADDAGCLWCSGARGAGPPWDSGGRWRCMIRGARFRRVRGRPRGPRPITSSSGPRVAGPI